MAACLIAALILIPTLVCVIFWQRRGTRRAFERVDSALDAALRGEPIPEEFDEALPSAIETKLRKLLAASSLSDARLREEKSRIEALISDIAHQTRTPIANLLLYAQLLQESASDSESRATAGEIEAQAERLRSLTEALVRASRLEAGLLQFHPEPNSIHSLIKTAAAQYQPAAEAKDIELTAEPTEVQAVFDPKWTSEALGNLLDNAIKYAPRGGHVRVSATALELYCRIDVADDGPGVPEAEHAAIFARFRRGAAHAQDAGVGLGLHLARQIVSAQGGYIKLSCPPEGGSIFSIYLPILSAP